jgi:hypothetical protein
VGRDVARQIRGIVKVKFSYYVSFTQDSLTDPIRFGCISKHSDSYVELESDYQNGLTRSDREIPLRFPLNVWKIARIKFYFVMSLCPSHIFFL